MWRWSRAWRRPGLPLAGGHNAACAAVGRSAGLRSSAAAASPPKAAAVVAAAAAAAAPRFPSPGWRRLSGLGSSEPREEEAAAVAAEGPGRGPGDDVPKEEGGGGQEPRAPPTDERPPGSADPVPAAFTFHDIVALLRQENASDICVIQLPPEVNYSNHFIIVSGSSGRHLHAMAQYLLKMYKQTVKGCRTHTVIEGKDTDDWLCIDFGHTVVHFMLPETREVYELEKLWTLRSHDDQLRQMVSESLPDDFTLGLTSEAETLSHA